MNVGLVGPNDGPALRLAIRYIMVEELRVKGVEGREVGSFYGERAAYLFTFVPSGFGRDQTTEPIRVVP